MSNATFRGGVHPYEGKELSKDLPIKQVNLPGEYVFPMAQHIGAPATPIVAEGRQGTGWTEDWRSQWLYFCQYLQFSFRNC